VGGAGKEDVSVLNPGPPRDVTVDGSNSLVEEAEEL
jgi:hypothetical protein